MPDFASPPWSGLVAFVGDVAVPIVVILVFAALALRFSRVFVHGTVKALMDREATEGTAQELSAVELDKRMRTLDELFENVVRFVIIVVAALMILSSIHIDIGPAIAGLGVVGVAVGFGAQHLVKDYLNGALILIENQFSKGDVITIAGVSGVVEDFSLRRTTLRDLDGNVHTVPNGAISVASNMTRVWARVNEDVTIAYGTDVNRVIDLIAEVGRTMAAEPEWRRRILEAPRVERIEALGDQGITVKVLGTVRAQDRWIAAGELRKRLLDAFAANGIEIPFPHRVILNRPADGSAASSATESAAAD